jgi:hypothetical protein
MRSTYIYRRVLQGSEFTFAANDLELVKVLAGSPAVLDLYMWLTYRCFRATGTETIPIFDDFGLAGQIGTVEYSRPRRFRGMLEQWLSTIRTIWPDCQGPDRPQWCTTVVRHAEAVRQLTQVSDL